MWGYQDTPDKEEPKRVAMTREEAQAKIDNARDYFYSTLESEVKFYTASLALQKLKTEFYELKFREFEVQMKMASIASAQKENSDGSIKSDKDSEG